MGETIQDWMGNYILNSVKKLGLIYEYTRISDLLFRVTES